MQDYDVVVTSDDGERTILVQANHAAAAFQLALNVVCRDFARADLDRIKSLSFRQAARVSLRMPRPVAPMQADARATGLSERESTTVTVAPRRRTTLRRNPRR